MLAKLERPHSEYRLATALGQLPSQNKVVVASSCMYEQHVSLIKIYIAIYSYNIGTLANKNGGRYIPMIVLT